MAYLGNAPGQSTQRVTTTFTATEGQTSFTPVSGYTPGYVDVYLNGVKLIDTSDYVATNGVSIDLITGADVDSVLEVVAYIPRGLSDGYTKLEADAKYTTIANFESTGIDDNATSTAITIADSNNVGIGTDSPSEALDVSGKVQVSEGYRIYDPQGDTYRNVIRHAAGNVILETGTGGGADITFLAGGQERMRIDNSGNIGIGGTPNSWSTVTNVLQMKNQTALSEHNGTGYFSQNWYYDAGEKYIGNGFAVRQSISSVDGSWVVLRAASNSSGAGASLTWAESMRIDANGNLLVGKNSTSGAIAGAELQSTGKIIGVSSNTDPLYLNRLNSHGVIAYFAKDGTTAGYIGTGYESSTEIGLSPRSNSDGGGSNTYQRGAPLLSHSMSDGNGTARGALYATRFRGTGGGITSGAGWAFTTSKNTYGPYGRETDEDTIRINANGIQIVKGGINFNPNATDIYNSDNTLDDYEEGTFTPVASSTVANVYHARYTKVGNLVTINTSFRVNAGQSLGSLNLPFNPSSNSSGNNGTTDQTNNRYAGAMSFFDNSTNIVSLMAYYQGNAGANLYFIGQDANGTQNWTETIDSTFGTVAVSMTYQTNS